MEHTTHNRVVGGSNPPAAIIQHVRPAPHFDSAGFTTRHRVVARISRQRRRRAVVLSVAKHKSHSCYDRYVPREITQRELRNDSGEIMRALDQGESFVVTRNGTPVGEL